MPFITKGKTNWRFLLIVFILAVIVGGGILLWQEKCFKEEIKQPEIFSKSKSIRDVDFVKYLTDITYSGIGGASEFCMLNQEPIYINKIIYTDIDTDGQEEAIIQASSCFTGTAGPDIFGVYKSVNSKLIELKINDNNGIFHDKNVYEGLVGNRNFTFDVRNDQIIEEFHDESDKNNPLTLFFQWDGKEITLTNAIFGE